MNERMIDLYREACEFAYKVCREEGRTGGPSDHIWNTLSTGRFAELIVWECINTLEFHGFEDAIPYVKWMATNKLGQHFGVEEPKGWICSKCGTDRTKAVCPQGPSASVDGRCPMIASAQ